MFVLDAPLNVILFILIFGAAVIFLIKHIRAREKQGYIIMSLVLAWLIVIGIYNAYMFRDLTFEEMQSKSMGDYGNMSIAYIELNEKYLLDEQDSALLMEYISNLTFNRAFNMVSYYNSDSSSENAYGIRMLDEQHNLVTLMGIHEKCVFNLWKERVPFFGDLMNSLWVTRSDDGRTLHQVVEDIYNRLENAPD